MSAEPYDICVTLIAQAAEIATADHFGWGNTMQDAATEIARLRAALAQPAVPEPMTREFCAAFPGTAAGIINELARQIDAAQEKP